MVTPAVKEETGVREFCDTAYRELTEMKAKAFDIICMVEKMPYEEGKIFRNVMHRACYFLDGRWHGGCVETKPKK